MTTDKQMVRLNMGDLEWVTELLSTAFLDQTPTTHLFQGPRRVTQTAYFMRCSCAYALLFGECYTTENKQGVALWLLPGSTAMTPGRMYKAGMLSAPLHMGLKAFRRFMGFAAHTDRLHRIAAPVPHYYLFALGVRPSAQGKGVGRLLVTKMLERIDREGLPTYLETQEQGNVGLYQQLGFDVVAQEAFPKLAGLDNWSMLRRAYTDRPVGA